MEKSKKTYNPPTFLQDSLQIGKFARYFTYYIMYIFFLGPIALIPVLILEPNPKAVLHNLHLLRLSKLAANNFSLSIVNLFVLYGSPKMIPLLLFSYPIMLMYILYMVVEVLYLTDEELHIFRNIEIESKNIRKSRESLEAEQNESKDGKYKRAPSITTKVRPEVVRQEHKHNLWLETSIRKCAQKAMISPKICRMKVFGLNDSVQEVHIKNSLGEKEFVEHEGLYFNYVSVPELFKNIFIDTYIASKRSLWMRILKLSIFVFVAGAGFFSAFYSITILVDSGSEIQVGKFSSTLFKGLFIWVSLARLVLFKLVFDNFTRKQTMFKLISNLIDVGNPNKIKVDFGCRSSLRSFMSLLALHYNYCKNDIKKSELIMGALAGCAIFDVSAYYLDRLDIIDMYQATNQLYFHISVTLDVLTFLTFLLSASLITVSYNLNYSSIRHSFERIRRVVKDLEVEPLSFELFSSEFVQKQEASQNQTSLLSPTLLYFPNRQEFQQKNTPKESISDQDNLTIRKDLDSMDISLIETEERTNIRTREEHYHSVLSVLIKKNALEEQMRMHYIKELIEDITLCIDEVNRHKSRHCIKLLGMQLKMSLILKISALTVPIMIDILRRTIKEVFEHRRK